MWSKLVRSRHRSRFQVAAVPSEKAAASVARSVKPRAATEAWDGVGSGSVKRYSAGKRHILTKRTTKNKRQLRGAAEVHVTNLGHVKAMLPYA